MKIRLPEAALPRPIDDLDTALLAEMYRRMVRIRVFETRVNSLFLQGLIPGTIHLSNGQEATVAGACLALEPSDRITITHRGHGQALAKGVDSSSLMAELLGRQTGCCKGKGGSLHVGDFSVGALPAIAIVGASSPIAAGMAFAYRHDGSGRVVANFIGDGTANKGDWHEAMNLASIWDLPVLFVCENNLWAVSTHLSDSMNVATVAERATGGYGMPAVTIDGNDPIAVYDAVREAAARARRGDGPSLVECMTYRQGGHKRDDPASYRPTEEVDAWLAHDPLPRFRQRLVDSGFLTEGELADIETEIDQEIDQSVEAAKASPYPDPESALVDVYG